MSHKIVSIGNFVYTWVIIFILWLAFTTTIELSEVLVGLASSFVISIFTYKMFSRVGYRSASPMVLFYLLKYLGVFLLALIRSNLNVARIVLSPKLPINPGIVEFESRLQSDFAKMILANSITLTPGTLSVDVVENRFYIHWLTVTTSDHEEAYNEIAKDFEDILIKIFK